MPFSVADFKSNTLTQGMIRPSHYEVNIQPPVGDGQLYTFRAESVSMPGAAFLAVDNYKPYGSGKLYTIPYAFNPQEINITLTVDGNAEVIQMMYDWANKIVDIDGQKKYSAYYLNTYVASMFEIKVFSQDGTKKKTYRLREAFPTTVDQMQMSWGTSDDTAKLSASYKFTEYTVL